MTGDATARPRLVRFPLWSKLAVFALLGVLATHAIYLVVGLRLTKDALVREQAALGRSIAQLAAREATEAVLVDDRITLHELAQSALSRDGVAYCLVVRGPNVLASAFGDDGSRALASLRRSGDLSPILAVSGDRRYLDVVEPILDGSAGHVRVGLYMSVLEETNERVTMLFGALALAAILVSLIAAFVVGGWVARPILELVAAADEFDPARPAPRVRPRGRDELAELADRFNRMMHRLVVAHEEKARARERQGQTERLAALGQLVAGVAHEVNNPLAGLKNVLRWLEREDPEPSPKRREYLELMREGLARIDGVMRHLLDFARPRSLALGEQPVSTLVEDTASLMRATLARRRVSLDVSADGARVLVDRQQAGQALLNLLLNAFYVTPDGGVIRVATRGRPGQLGIVVEDDGPGIPEAIRSRVLDPFFSTKPEGEGTGLGLPVTRTIMEAHGGELAFEFPARGTTAILWFPTAPPEGGGDAS